ncbi:phosphonate metabolism transcriptional regulator PhnF [Paracoccus aerodenitrificans]|uniref:phosphonate metabolism transcriptional regulator PhnF n=1 Tax=Paracoccus aerodenitrificans TaxID=3017781 RepID=UPI0022F06C5A|nr:phosphonate metabolism transcriptional regulator PhnF [Paracoccus aerodenitrificans]WBU64377.1 phosphonate metabolism transcriptional regulator PhnF [Paracoccus aerodenitrificans]
MSLWQSIADTLRAEISRGVWRPGTRLPPEAELAARFGVNRHTLRNATRSLAEQGLLYSRRGAGVYVAAAPVEYRLGERVRFHHNIELAGRVPGRRIDSVVTRACDAAEAEALALSPGDPVHAVEGIATVDHRPVALFRSVFPARLLPGLPEALSQGGSLTRALAACGIADYTRSGTRIKAAIADEMQAAKLQIDPGEPLLRTDSTDISDGRPIERGVVWWASERITLTHHPDQG